LPEYKLLIVCIYRSPKEEFDKFLNKLEMVIQKLLKKDKILILCGDWNIDFLSDNGNLNDLKDLLLRYNLINTVQSPTRVTKRTNTLINVMIINRKYYMEPATVVDLGLSDHHAQLVPVLFKNHTDVDQKVLKRYFGEENIKEFTSLLEKLSWQKVFSETEVNAKFKAFMDLVLYQFNVAFPLQLRHRKKPLWKGWITQGIIMSSKKMRFLNMLQKQPNLTVEAKTYIDKYRRIYKRVIREEKIRENDRHILHEKHKTKAVWQIINRESGKISSNKLDIKLNWNSEDITHPQNVAELLNSIFSKISEELVKRTGSRMTNPVSQHVKINVNTNTMFLSPITENKMENAAKALKNKLSAGIDEIPDCVVKQCIKVLKRPLTNIYNASLESGIFPDQLKVAKVIPLYKKGDRKDVGNYRPIALLSVFSKLLEKLMYNRVISFIEQNKIITEAQHGFRMKRSTETALQFFIGSIQEAIERKMNPVGIFLDLTKAYDVLNCKILLSKLDSYGIRGVANLWFESYLSHRKQCVWKYIA
jgi:uncharacterized protein YktA (UPF0223 family)